MSMAPIKMADLDILAWHRSEEQSSKEAAEDYRDPSEGSAEFNEIMVGVSEELAAMHGRFADEITAKDSQLREADALLRRVAAHTGEKNTRWVPFGSEARAYVAKYPAETLPKHEIKCNRHATKTRRLVWTPR